MKMVIRLIPLVLLACIITACGYHNPNVYSGPSKSIYITEWKNRTSELSIDSKIYRSLTKWFQRSSSITVVRQKEGADLILGGEIVSIALPSLSYGTNFIATEVKIILKVRYILKEIATNKIVLEVPEEIRLEEYLLTSDSKTNSDNETEALEKIIEDLSQKIYQKTVSELPKL